MVSGCYRPRLHWVTFVLFLFFRPFSFPWINHTALLYSAVLGALDEQEDAMTDLSELRAAPLNPVVY